MTFRNFIFISALLCTANVWAQSPVRTSTAENQKLQQRQQVTGTLRAVARGDIAALEAGLLLELTVYEGDTVKKGDIIARVDARRLEAQKAELLAEGQLAEAELARQAVSRLAAANLRRTEGLFEKNAESRHTLDQHRADVEIVAAEIEAAKRKIERIQQSVRLIDVRLSDTQIKAPYDASVVERHVEPGDWVAAGDPLLTLVSIGPIQAWLEVPERFADAITRHRESIVIHSSSTSQSFQSISTKRVSDVNPRVRTISLIVTIPNPENVLAPGMSVDAWIAAGERKTYLTVPKDSIIRQGRESFVFGVQQDGGNELAKRHAVSILFETPTLVAIESSTVHSGDEVIVEGNERLLPDQLVAVTRTGTSPTSKVAKR